MNQKFWDFRNSGDPRMSNLPMMDSPLKTVVLVVLYLALVKYLIPAWMRFRKPYSLKNPMIIYNFTLVVLSTWIFLELGILGWFTKYSWICEPIDFSLNPDAVRITRICWCYYMTKFLEFFDTIFFVLRKKDSQVTTLHVFHHALVPITLWFGIKYGAGGYNTIFPILNSFVHIWMYLYYGLAAFGPAVQKYLWWKKYLTLLQMVQFITIFVFMLQLFVYPTCQVSGPLLALSLVQAVIFFALFLHFYARSYKSKATRKESANTVSNSEHLE